MIQAKDMDRWTALWADGGVQMAPGVPPNIDGEFMTIRRRQSDGSRELYRDIFNPNVPSS